MTPLGSIQSAPASAAPPARAPEQASWIKLAFDTVAPIFWQLALASVAINLLALTIPIFVLQIYDRVIPHSSFETLKGLLIGAILLLVFDFLLRQARSRLLRRVALRVDVTATRALFARLSGLPLRALEARSDAEWRRLLRDGDTLRDTVAGPSVILMVDLPFAVVMVAVISFIAPPLLPALIALATIYLTAALVSARVVRARARAEQEAQIGRDRLAGELVAGRATIKALGLGASLRARWEAAQARMIERSMVRGAAVDGFNNLSASLMMLSTMLITTVGAVAIVNQQMTIGGLIAANMLAMRALQPLSQVVGLWRGVETFRQASQRVNELLALTPEPAAGPVKRPRPAGEVTLERVAFAHDPSAAPAVDGVSLTFSPGRMYGVLGANGSGKTTLVKLIQGLHAPSEGRVLIDGIDVAQLGRDEISAWVGYAPQEPFLFEGTIADNISRGREGRDEAVLAAARRAAAITFIDDLPNGFATEVGEGGRLLSSGQRQRLALARAWVEDPPILLLDEPSASLDFEAEAQLVEQLTRLKQDRTIIIVSHSTRLLAACDHLVVMHAGRVALSGSAEEVLPGARTTPRRPAAAASATASPSPRPERRLPPSLRVSPAAHPTQVQAPAVAAGGGAKRSNA